MPVNPTDQQEFSDADFRIVAKGDQSKKLAFEVSGVATGTTRTWTVPNSDLTMWGSVSATFTGTLTGPTLRLTSTGDASVSSTGHAFQVGASDDLNIIIDDNEIMARHNGATTTLFLNFDGGNVSVGSGTLNLGGGRINFPATQSPSSDANTLDDYEEGTFTPTAAFTTPGTSSWAYTVQSGRYTKIGNTVSTSAVIDATPTIGTGSGVVTFSGFPFTAAENASLAVSNLSINWTWPTSRTMVSGVMLAGTSTFRARTQGSAQNASDLSASNMTTGTIHAIRFGGVVFV